MSGLDDSSTEKTVLLPLVPTYPDDKPILWDDNDASLGGLIADCGEFFERTGIGMEIFETGSVTLSNGRTAVDNLQAIPFLEGTYSDSYGFDKPCPPTPARVADYELVSGSKVSAITSMPDKTAGTYIVNKQLIRLEKAKICTVFVHAIGKCPSAAKIITEAKGDGIKLKELLEARYAKADPEDVALCSSEFIDHHTRGISGELTSANLSEWAETYQRLKRRVGTSLRPGSAAEVQMINLIAYKSPEVRGLYQMKCTAKPPSTFEEAIAYVEAILKNAKRFEQIDLISRGATDSAPPGVLAVTNGRPDPNKGGAAGGAAGGKPKVKIPRDKTGHVIKWVEGMDICRCGIDGDKHLFRDCPKWAKEKAKREHAAAAPSTTAPPAPAPAPAPAACPPKPTLVADGVGDFTDAELARQMMEFFDSAQPAEETGHVAAVASGPGPEAGPKAEAERDPYFGICFSYPGLTTLDFPTSAFTAPRAVGLGPSITLSQSALSSAFGSPSRTEEFVLNGQRALRVVGCNVGVLRGTGPETPAICSADDSRDARARSDRSPAAAERTILLPLPASTTALEHTVTGLSAPIFDGLNHLPGPGRHHLAPRLGSSPGRLSIGPPGRQSAREPIVPSYISAVTRGTLPSVLLRAPRPYSDTLHPGHDVFAVPAAAPAARSPPPTGGGG